MQLNYKPIGNYIQEVNLRNTDLRDLPLIGLSIAKQFIPSIANTIGTDMSNYRVIERNNFAYCGVTSRNGEKITIALFENYDKALISQAYTVFKIIDTEELLPEYLMMWFRRPEFDRYARFHSHGSVREIFDWNELCETLLPVPPISTQRSLVAEYNAVQNRIDLNNQLIQKLEQTAQAIYKKYFVEEVDRENLPEGWKMTTIGNVVETLGGGTPSTEINEYWENGDILWYSPSDLTKSDSSVFSNETEKKITKLGLQKSSAKLFPANCLLMTSRATVGKITINTKESCANQGFITLIPTEKFPVYYLVEWLKTQLEEINSLATGSTFPEISKTDFRNLKIIQPTDKVIEEYNSKVSAVYTSIKFRIEEIQKLQELQSLLLAKMAGIEDNRVFTGINTNLSTI